LTGVEVALWELREYEEWTQGARIDYKELGKMSREAATRAVVEYRRSNGHNTSVTARVFDINRCVVHGILAKWATGDLRDRPRIPKQWPNKTAAEIED